MKNLLVLSILLFASCHDHSSRIETVVISDPLPPVVITYEPGVDSVMLCGDVWVGPAIYIVGRAVMDSIPEDLRGEVTLDLGGVWTIPVMQMAPGHYKAADGSEWELYDYMAYTVVPLDYLASLQVSPSALISPLSAIIRDVYGYLCLHKGRIKVSHEKLIKRTGMAR